MTWLLPHALRLFQRGGGEASVARRRFHVYEPEHITEVEGIGTAFLTGFNAMVRHQRLADVRHVCESLSAYRRPFAYEGAAMGFGLRSWLRCGWRLEEFERFIEQLNPRYRYLYFVGLGWWVHQRYQKKPTQADRLIRTLNPYYRYLCHDGFGFKTGFYEYPRDPSVISRFQGFSGYGSHACFQGFGRSLWFVYRDAHEKLFARINSIEPLYRGDCYAGLGLAIAFTQVENLTYAFDFLQNIEAPYRDEFLLGLVFALAARQMNDEDYFGEQIAKLERHLQTFVNQSLRGCDESFAEAVELGEGDSVYERWRRQTRERAAEIWRQFSSCLTL